MGFYVYIKTKSGDEVRLGWFATREEALRVMADVVSKNLGQIVQADLSDDVPPEPRR